MSTGGPEWERLTTIEPDCFLRGDIEPVEALREQCAAEVGHGQEAAAAGDGGALIDPVCGRHRSGELQLVDFGCHGGDGKYGVRACQLDCRNLVGRRVEGNSQPEHNADAVGSAGCGCPVELAVDALHHSGVGLEAIVGGVAKGVQIRVVAARADPKHDSLVVCAAQDGRAVEIAVAAQEQSGSDKVSIAG